MSIDLTIAGGYKKLTEIEIGKIKLYFSFENGTDSDRAPSWISYVTGTTMPKKGKRASREEKFRKENGP